MEVVIKKNLRTLDADNNFTYVIEVTHNGELVNKSPVKVHSDEYAQPIEECCGSLTIAAINAILDQLTFEFKDFDPATVPIREEIIAQ